MNKDKSIKIPKLYATYDYSIFKFIESNRNTKAADLRKLKKSILTKNFLRLFPIIVNKVMEVIEGQHRLKVAQELGYPIYYFIDDEITKGDIAMINNTRKSWTSRDFIKFYADEGCKPYQYLRQMLNDYTDVTIMTGVKLMDKKDVSYFSGSNTSQTLKAGKINSDNYKLAIKICELCKKLSKEKKQYAFDASFMLDIKNVILQSDMSQDECVNKIFRMRHILPDVLEFGESCLRILKELLGVNKREPQKSIDESDWREIKKKQQQSITA